MFAAARDRLSLWLSNINKPQSLLDSAIQPSLVELVGQAKEQWQQAMTYFENVSDPELVDYAINNLEAAEKRYNYLLKQLRVQ